MIPKTGSCSKIKTGKETENGNKMQILQGFSQVGPIMAFPSVYDTHSIFAESKDLQKVIQHADEMRYTSKTSL